MATPMIRKQVYLAREQDKKLKALAHQRGCTEAEVIRDALDGLPDPGGTVDDQLAAAGLLALKGDVSDAPSGAAARALHAEVESWLDARATALRLSQAVADDRRGL